MLVQKPIPKHLSFDPIIEADAATPLQCIPLPSREVLAGRPGQPVIRNAPGGIERDQEEGRFEGTRKSQCSERAAKPLWTCSYRRPDASLRANLRETSYAGPYAAVTKHVDCSARNFRTTTFSAIPGGKRVRDRLKNGWPGKPVEEVRFRVLGEARLAARDGGSSLELLQLVPAARLRLGPRTERLASRPTG